MPEMTDRELIDEAISIYIEQLREDDDSHNNAMADRLEEIEFATSSEIETIKDKLLGF